MAAEMGFDDEIHNFTALLSLPPNQALPLLHDTWRLPNVPLTYSPAFPSNDTSVSSSGAARSSKPNSEPPNHAQQLPQRAGKRKEVEKAGKVKAAAKKSRNGTEENRGGGESEKLPYVHVRARRGQATDSHSLAERARREKINERMKLLQELVPGCSKISGTALVLDEIINHVQCLQRQVEFLSLRLAAVNPRIDFSSFDNFLSAEFGRVMACGNIPMPSSDFIMNGHQQIWLADSSLPFISTASSSTPTIPCSSPKTPSLTYGCNTQTN